MLEVPLPLHRSMSCRGLALPSVGAVAALLVASTALGADAVPCTSLNTQERCEPAGAEDAVSLLNVKRAAAEPGLGAPMLANAQQRQQWYIPNETFAFMHVGKCAGSSFDKWMLANGLAHAIGGGIHADMSYIDAHARGDPHKLGFLREPAARAASNILFWNTLEFTEDFIGRNMSLTQILNDPEALKGYAGAYSDGWGGVFWLAGLCPNGWYVHTNPDGKNETERKRRNDTLHSDPELAVKLATEQLERFAWFGLLDQTTESMDMLKWQLDLDPSAPGLIIANKNAHDHNAVTEEDLDHLRTLLPMDMALYRYANKLFEQRLSAYQAETAAGRNANEAAAPFPHLNPDEQDNEHVVSLTSVAYVDYLLPMDALINDFASGVDN